MPGDSIPSIHLASTSIRFILASIASGEAAGAAAGIAAWEGKQVRKLDVPKLQERLVQRNVVLAGSPSLPGQATRTSR